ncbi:hypothetical protein BDY17DRAFT_73605 [Neohortaea acidophila]|uniref:Uncharacterized protein n=1 Tax=Neohortaea acidophila TaxID=245834 RepID=A0A6A6Q199_9PEZI|nr:uncharacterized protein BDY17DRAFT_73605 [Neohortaea acidophila]KAF2486248.1 hypothetical protein BDY17DRAFT_73605 [Neohortaea acidophila]
MRRRRNHSSLKMLREMQKKRKGAGAAAEIPYVRAPLPRKVGEMARNKWSASFAATPHSHHGVAVGSGQRSHSSVSPPPCSEGRMSVHAGPMTKPEARAGRKEQDAAKVWKHCARF